MRLRSKTATELTQVNRQPKSRPENSHDDRDTAVRVSIRFGDLSCKRS